MNYVMKKNRDFTSGEQEGVQKLLKTAGDGEEVAELDAEADPRTTTPPRQRRRGGRRLPRRSPRESCAASTHIHTGEQRGIPGNTTTAPAADHTS
jgi:hypothetical protein